MHSTFEIESWSPWIDIKHRPNPILRKPDGAEQVKSDYYAVDYFDSFLGMEKLLLAQNEIAMRK